MRSVELRERFSHPSAPHANAVPDLPRRGDPFPALSRPPSQTYRALMPGVNTHKAAICRPAAWVSAAGLVGVQSLVFAGVGSGAGGVAAVLSEPGGEEVAPGVRPG
jgi:hypothetical protein